MYTVIGLSARNSGTPAHGNIPIPKTPVTSERSAAIHTSFPQQDRPRENLRRTLRRRN
jgi:hypothetical protein